MGKKKGGKATEKAVGKGDRNKAERKLKKLLAEIGEADVKDILQQRAQPNNAVTRPTFVPCSPPSPRCNISVVAHPERDELFFFGGDFFNGSKATVYDDLLLYKIKSNEWFVYVAPADQPRPLPRASHQTLMSPLGGGQIWLFGGEFSSPSQLQFHHFSDLWTFHVKENRWESISASGDVPSPRSGHKMVEFKRHLVVFGGFFETNNNCTYFNDVHVFDVSSRKWKVVKPLGEAPPPRSNAQVVCLPSMNSILVYGGYSKTRASKKADVGTTHCDMYLLQVDGIEAFDAGTSKTPLAAMPWRWVPVRQGGDKPTPPKCGCSAVALPSAANSKSVRVLFFGGVFDQENEDAINGSFSNDPYIFDVEKRKWTRLIMKMASSGESIESQNGIRPRMNTALVTKGNSLFMYGGMCEVKDRQVTLSDFYVLNLTRFDDGWTTIIADTADKQEWLESDSDDEDASLMDIDDVGDDSDDSSSDDDDDDDDSDDE